MTTMTAPGQEAGLIWDRSRCTHPPGERCGGPKGCRVDRAAARAWNDLSRGWWRELNRIAKQHADRALKRLGHKQRGGLLAYQREM